jgi:hypothetical protein
MAQVFITQPRQRKLLKAALYMKVPAMATVDPALVSRIPRLSADAGAAAPLLDDQQRDRLRADERVRAKATEEARVRRARRYWREEYWRWVGLANPDR